MNSHLGRIARLDAIVRQFSLNEHPFYVEWRAGRLPAERLADYAAEWAPFIACIDKGWERIGEPDYAAEEREHDRLWSRFLGALGTGKPGAMRKPHSRTLLAVAERAFASVPEALGALYSFEVQQPATAQSKLAGLREHYSGIVDEAAQEYFRVHATETDEPAMLAARIEGLSEGEFAQAHTACASLSAAAWGALDGVHYAELRPA
jgi:pyrroloquinoline-quinone synthase